MVITTKKKENNLFESNIIDPNAPILPISLIARMLEVHQRTLRIYDEIGLLVPTRTEKNRRLYSLNDVERGKCIQYLTRELEVNLAGVKIIFQLLEELKLAPDEYGPHLQSVAKALNITEKQQIENRQKSMRKGRKAKDA